MVKYICDKCGRQFNHKGHYDYHINKKKKPCIKTTKNTVKMDGKMEGLKCFKCGKCYTRKDNLLRHIRSYCLIDDPINKSVSNRQHHYNINTDLNIKTALHKDKYICIYCKKLFSRSDSLTRHLQYSCKAKKELDDQKEELYYLLLDQMTKQNQQIEELQKNNRKIKLLMKNNEIKYKNEINSLKENNCNIIVNNTENRINNIQNNIINNIKLVPFGKEDLSFISDSVCKLFLKKGYQSVPKLIEDVHFNINNKELHNVYIPNMKNLYAMIFVGNHWGLKNKQEVIDQLFDDKQCFLIEKYKELENTLDSITKKKFKRFIEESDDKIITDLKDDIKLMLYNNRKIPMETKKMYEKKLLHIQN